MPTDGVHDPIGNKRKCGLAACNNDLDSNASRTRAACSARGPPVPYELRPGTWTRLMVAVMRLAGGPDLGIVLGSGP